MERITIRQAMPDDEGKVVQCIQASFEKYIVRIGKKPGPMLHDYFFLIAGGRVFCAEYGGEIIGVLVLEDADGYLLLDTVAILPEFQGKGLGKQLIGFAEQYALDNNYPEIRLYTNEKMTENIPVYRKLGYIEYDRHEEDGFARIYFKKSLSRA